MSEIIQTEFLEETKQQSNFDEQGFNESYTYYEVQGNDGQETIYSITAKMASENLPNEYKALFRKLILDFAEKEGFSPLKQGDTIIFEKSDGSIIELSIQGEVFVINLVNYTITKM